MRSACVSETNRTQGCPTAAALDALRAIFTGRSFCGKRFARGSAGGGVTVRCEFAVTGSLAGIRNFAASESISSSETFQWQFESTTFRYFGNIAANFGPGSYVGLRFPNDNGSTFNYGYLEATWDTSTTTFQILSGAYETTPGLAISVPEPSTITLLAAVTLAGGLFVQRRTRR